MSLGARVRQLRLEANRTQKEISQRTGLAVSYFSRLENDRVVPSLRTLTKIAAGLGVPLGTLFPGKPVAEPGDRCPISLSGRCVLDQMFLGRGRKPKIDVESYTAKQLEILRLCNYLLHSGDREIVGALSTMMKSLASLAASKK